MIRVSQGNRDPLSSFFTAHAKCSLNVPQYFLALLHSASLWCTMQQNDVSLLSLLFSKAAAVSNLIKTQTPRSVSLIGLKHVSQHIIEPPALLISQIVELISEV